MGRRRVSPTRTLRGGLPAKTCYLRMGEDRVPGSRRYHQDRIASADGACALLRIDGSPLHPRAGLRRLSVLLAREGSWVWTPPLYLHLVHSNWDILFVLKGGSAASLLAFVGGGVFSPTNVCGCHPPQFGHGRWAPSRDSRAVACWRGDTASAGFTGATQLCALLVRLHAASPGGSRDVSHN